MSANPIPKLVGLVLYVTPELRDGLERLRMLIGGECGIVPSRTAVIRLAVEELLRRRLGKNPDGKNEPLGNPRRGTSAPRARR
jgi:hypothetical protein